MTEPRRRAPSTDPTVQRLQRQVQLLQAERLLQDPLATGVRRGVLERYLRALAGLVTERLPRGFNLGGGGSGTRQVGSTRREDPTPGWADDLVRLEFRVLADRTRRIESWLATPRPVRPTRARRCAGCGAGGARGARYCSRCGQQLPE